MNPETILIKLPSGARESSTQVTTVPSREAMGPPAPGEPEAFIRTPKRPYIDRNVLPCHPKGRNGMTQFMQGNSYKKSSSQQ